MKSEIKIKIKIVKESNKRLERKPMQINSS